MAPYATSSPKSAESVAKSVRRPYRDGTVGGTVSVMDRIQSRIVRLASASDRAVSGPHLDRLGSAYGPSRVRHRGSTRVRDVVAVVLRAGGVVDAAEVDCGRIELSVIFQPFRQCLRQSPHLLVEERLRAVAAEPRQRALRDGHLPEALEGVSAPLDAPPNRPRDLDALVRRAVKGRAVRNVPVVRSVPVVRVAVKGAGVAVEHLENIVEDVRALVHRSHRASVAVCRVGGDGGPERASAAVVVYQARRPRGEVHEQVVVELLQDAIKVVGLAMARLYSDKARVDASEPEGLERLDAVGEVDKVARSTLCV
eukprot:CAMPEP_0184198404 /NCGR_PEP_ID=MMETSP0976-20121227/6501_1 /TAXON_ID=483370 /ORGANISM="non described non described, Strain CCMP2097" /LENGTH=310 /DNA_ID=CAMNT_0026502885 /DNA_START=109 /DNA_END=1042 /DNA_ORIENTATION=+